MVVWLRGRQQRVVVEGEESTWRDVPSSVVQGSVLGGLLFVIFINDIDVGIGSFFRKFANDTKIVHVVENEKDRAEFQRDLDKLNNWASHCVLTLENAKFCILVDPTDGLIMK